MYVSLAQDLPLCIPPLLFKAIVTQETVKVENSGLVLFVLNAYLPASSAHIPFSLTDFLTAHQRLVLVYATALTAEYCVPGKGVSPLPVFVQMSGESPK